MRSKTVRFLSPEPLRAFRKPGRVWSLKASCDEQAPEIWVQCHGTPNPEVSISSTPILALPLRGGGTHDTWFEEGLHFPHGLVIALSSDQYTYEPLTAVPASIGLTLDYKTDAEIARDAAARARWERRPDDPHSVAVSLHDLLRTGDFGPIHLGMSRGAVLDALGKPDDFSVAESQPGLPAIFKYGDIEFYFDYDDDHLTLVRADTFNLLTGGSALRFDPWFMRQGTPQREVEEQLTVCGIEYQRVALPGTPPDTMTIKTISGVELGFEPLRDDQATLGLNSISWNGRGPESRPARQVPASDTCRQGAAKCDQMG